MIEQGDFFEMGKENETREAFELSSFGNWEDTNVFNKNGTI